MPKTIRETLVELMDLLKKEGINPNQRMFIQLDEDLTLDIEIITKQLDIQEHTWDFAKVRNPEYFWGN